MGFWDRGHYYRVLAKIVASMRQFIKMKPYQLLVLATIFTITSCKKNPNPAKGLAAGVYVLVMLQHRQLV